jgi:hypothetical protein
VVARADTTALRVYATVKTGTPALLPLAPELAAGEISLARALLAAGTAEIRPANVADERYDLAVCGLAGVAKRPDPAMEVQSDMHLYLYDEFLFFQASRAASIVDARLTIDYDCGFYLENGHLIQEVV